MPMSWMLSLVSSRFSANIHEQGLLWESGLQDRLGSAVVDTPEHVEINFPPFQPRRNNLVHWLGVHLLEAYAINQ